MMAVVINKTNCRFHNVQVKGVGAPGEYGNCVGGSYSSVSYDAEALDSHFTVNWDDESGTTRTQRVTVPVDYALGGRKMLVIEFVAIDKVIAYTEDRPGL